MMREKEVSIMRLGREGISVMMKEEGRIEEKVDDGRKLRKGR